MHPTSTAKEVSQESKLFSYAKTFLVPTLVLKGFVMYFGLNYSMHPGEGYGWGLLVTISLTLINFSIFIWKNWNDDSEES